MRQLAAVVGSLGLLFAAFLALDPVSVEVPHADGRCGPPAVRWAAQEGDKDPNAQAIIDLCEEAAVERLTVAGVAAAIGLLGFVLLSGIARRHDHVERKRKRALREKQAEARAASAAATRDPDYASS